MIEKRCLRLEAFLLHQTILCAVFCPVRYFVQYGILSNMVFCPVWYYNHWYFGTGIMTCGILYCGILTAVFCPRYFVRRHSDPLVFRPWYFVRAPDVVTRWNSTSDMIKRFQFLNDVLYSTLSQMKVDWYINTSRTMNFSFHLQEFVSS